MKNIFKKFQIGSLTLKNSLLAAPMAGLSSLPYRLLAMEQGCALAFSEMVSAEGILRAQKRTKRYYTNDMAARPFAVQVFGANPNAIAEAISALENEPIDLIDINMGCPVKKVCSKGAGVALMKSPKMVETIVKAARSSTKLPLTVKIRSGWSDVSMNYIEIAKIIEDCGADAITVHPRTREQFFKGHSNWEHIRNVKEVVKIPVIGNGDVNSRESAIRMLNETNCDAIMIGRAAVGNPWIFGQILNDQEPPSPKERGDIALRHLDHLVKLLDEKHALLSMRTLLPWYAKGLRGVKKLMNDVHQIKTIDEMKKTVEKFFTS